MKSIYSLLEKFNVGEQEEVKKKYVDMLNSFLQDPNNNQMPEYNQLEKAVVGLFCLVARYKDLLLQPLPYGSYREI